MTNINGENDAKNFVWQSNSSASAQPYKFGNIDQETVATGKFFFLLSAQNLKILRDYNNPNAQLVLILVTMKE